MHASVWFVTLTYDDEHLPASGGLDPQHLVDFRRRLQRRVGKFRYFACGEYGEETVRPHYHAVLFGVDLYDRTRYVRSGPPVWTSATLERAWKQGRCEVSAYSFAAGAYVAGYVTKKLRRGVERVNTDTGEILPREFTRMSKHPAIGKEWFLKYWKDVYPRDFVVANGKEVKPPRYYDKLLENMNPEMAMEVRLKRYEEAVELEKVELQAKETIHKARNALYDKRNQV